MKEINFRKGDKPKDIDFDGLKRRATKQILQQTIESDLRSRVEALEAALMPFAARGKILVSEVAEVAEVHAADCVNAFKTLYPQGTKNEY